MGTISTAAPAGSERSATVKGEADVTMTEFPSFSVRTTRMDWVASWDGDRVVSDVPP